MISVSRLFLRFLGVESMKAEKKTGNADHYDH